MEKETFIILTVAISLYIITLYFLNEEEINVDSEKTEIVSNVLDNVDKTINSTNIPVGYYDILSYNGKILMLILLLGIFILTLVMYNTLYTKNKIGNKNLLNTLYIKDEESHKNILNKPWTKKQ